MSLLVAQHWTLERLVHFLQYKYQCALIKKLLYIWIYHHNGMYFRTVCQPVPSLSALLADSHILSQVHSSQLSSPISSTPSYPPSSPPSSPLPIHPPLQSPLRPPLHPLCHPPFNPLSTHFSTLNLFLLSTLDPPPSSPSGCQAPTGKPAGAATVGGTSAGYIALVQWAG